MRAMWCTLIALCLVAAGAQPHRVHRSSGGTPTLRVAASGSSAAVRRPTSAVGPYVVAGVPVVSAPVRSLVVDTPAAPRDVTSSQLRSPRSSRGPPHV
jgi:hypothetical protein